MNVDLCLSDGAMDEAKKKPQEQVRRTVLVVEDDSDVAAVTAAQLEDFGHVVRIARSPAEALQLLRSGASFDVVFSDIVLPGEMSGFQLARAIRTEFPDMPVLLMTGFSATYEVAQIRQFETIAKPFDAATVAARLAQLIRAGPAGRN